MNNVLERLEALVNGFEAEHGRLPGKITVSRRTRKAWQFEHAYKYANPWTGPLFPKDYKGVPVVGDDVTEDGFIVMGD